MSAVPLSNVLPLFPDPPKPPKKKFTPPTLEDVLSHAIKSELPPLEAKKFFHHYEMVGWVVGKARSPMKNWHSAMAGWKIRWEERRLDFRREESNSQKLFILGTQLEQVENDMKRLWNDVPDAANGKMWQSFPKQKAEYLRLRKERERLQAEIAKIRPA